MSMTGRSGPDINMFDLNDDSAYQNWRAHKLAAQPTSSAGLIVPIVDPYHLDPIEIAALIRLIRASNMAIYDLGRTGHAGKDFVRKLGRIFGLERLDGNPLSDDDDISSIAVKPRHENAVYIPYTDRPISWHSDGYYNEDSRQVRAFILHCVQPAANGGENRLFDPDLAYIHLRDENPDYIRALMGPDVMTIPANEVNDFITRPAISGPVFRVHADGALHMRFTARKRHVIWSDDILVRQAADCLLALLDSDSRFITRHRLKAGQGLIANNVLHNRSVFHHQPGAETSRLLYRARYYDRIRDTSPTNFLEAI